jgi:predicted phosphodiesterase
MALALIGIIGDVHGEDVRLENALRFLEAQTENVFCTGDVVDGAGDVNRCCALLQEHGVVTVRGNHDRWLLEGSMRDLKEATPVQELTENRLPLFSCWPQHIPSILLRGARCCVMASAKMICSA